MPNGVPISHQLYIFRLWFNRKGLQGKYQYWKPSLRYHPWYGWTKSSNVPWWWQTSLGKNVRYSIIPIYICWYNSIDSDIIKHKQTFFTSVDRRSVKERTVMPLIPLEWKTICWLHLKMFGLHRPFGITINVVQYVHFILCI